MARTCAATTMIAMGAVVTAAELAEIREHAEAVAPTECCGVILTRGPERRVFDCLNVQDGLHAHDPVRFPRDARTAYTIAVEDLLAIAALEAEGWTVAVIYHSHVDADAGFSPADRAGALCDGAPAYPDATYVVVSVRDGRAGEARAFRWDEPARDFQEVSP